MSAYPLEPVGAASLGFHLPALARLEQVIEGHIAQGRYPGAQLALARHGKLAMVKSFGRAALAPERATRDDTLFLVFSNTKVITAAGIWALVEDGVLSFSDRIAKHIPEFAKHGKGDITINQLLSHRAGFPSQDMPAAAWTNHALMREQVCDFTLEWTPGSRLAYHQRSAHWTAAAVIEAVTGSDYREFLRKRITEPLGIADDQFMGMPMHRGLGTHQRGMTESIRGLGSLASPNTFGHGGAGNSYCWGDPDSGVSFAYLSNCRIPDPWHSERMEIISNLVHMAID